MKLFAKTILLLLALVSTGWVCAADLSPAAQTEITHLISRMENSGCEFNRNGSWYNATDASAHIKRKYQYLRQKELLSSAEDFIVGAATESSISKQPYLVRCPDTLVVESSSWFRKALDQYRQSHGNRAK